MAKSTSQKFGEFVGFSILTIGLLLFLALSVSISYFVVTWAFGLR